MSCVKSKGEVLAYPKGVKEGRYIRCLGDKGVRVFACEKSSSGGEKVFTGCL